jgi:hypothetical protein
MMAWHSYAKSKLGKEVKHMKQTVEEVLAPERWPVDEAILVSEEKGWENLVESISYENDQEVLFYENQGTFLNEGSIIVLDPEVVTSTLQSLIRILKGKTRQEQKDMYSQAIEAIRKTLHEAESKSDIYALVDFATDLDRAMIMTNTWRYGWDTYEKLHLAFEEAERNIMRLEAIKVSQARYDAYARSVEVFSFNKEAKTKVDYQAVPA